MTEELKTLRYHRDGLIFSWLGGAYIEIYFEGHAIPYDVFNVWDYEKGESRIEFSMLGLVNFVDEQMLDEEEWGALL